MYIVVKLSLLYILFLKFCDYTAINFDVIIETMQPLFLLNPIIVNLYMLTLISIQYIHGAGFKCIRYNMKYSGTYHILIININNIISACKNSLTFVFRGVPYLQVTTSYQTISNTYTDICMHLI